MKQSPEYGPGLTELFPDLSRGGDLVFCAYADRSKLRSILTSGIKPRGGFSEPASYYPNAVSLMAIGKRFHGNGFISSTDGIWHVLYFNSNYRQEIPRNEHAFNYIIVLNSNWAKGNLDALVGVGDSVRASWHKDKYRINGLKDLSLSPDPDELAWNNEVHFTKDTIPPSAFKGVALAETHKGKVKGAEDLIREEIARVKADSSCSLASPLALYSREGVATGILG